MWSESVDGNCLSFSGCCGGFHAWKNNFDIYHRTSTVTTMLSLKPVKRCQYWRTDWHWRAQKKFCQYSLPTLFATSVQKKMLTKCDFSCSFIVAELCWMIRYGRSDGIMNKRRYSSPYSHSCSSVARTHTVFRQDEVASPRAGFVNILFGTDSLTRCIKVHYLEVGT